MPDSEMLRAAGRTHLAFTESPRRSAWGSAWDLKPEVLGAFRFTISSKPLSLKCEDFAWEVFRTCLAVILRGDPPLRAPCSPSAHLMTSSARSRMDSGRTNPSALAVVTFTRSENWAG